MDRSDFLGAIFDAAKELKEALDAPSRRWFVNMIAIGYDGNPPNGADAQKLTTDRIFEFMLYLYLVGHLCRTAARWRMILGDGEFGYRLPYSPGAKTNFAFFRYDIDGEFLDLCCGVEIPVQGEPAEAPDISLQQVDTWDAAQRHSGALVGLWECKYHKRGKTLTRSDFNQMVARCEVLRPPQCAAGDWLERVCPEPFQVHALVTNAASPPNASFNRGQRLRLRFSLVFGFTGAVGAVAYPTRAEHLIDLSPPEFDPEVMRVLTGPVGQGDSADGPEAPRRLHGNTPGEPGG